MNVASTLPQSGSSGEPCTRAAPPPLTADSALYLDFDGTLVELAPTPDAVRPPCGLPALLADLQRLLGGALALISGRRLESIDRYLRPLRLPGAGLHGAQLRRSGDGGAEDPRLPAPAPLLRALQAHFGDDPRVLIENKGAAVALHYRLAPERAAECEQRLRSLAHQHGLDVISGHAVVEARPVGIDKGVGLRRLAEMAPFAGRRPVFVGDDRTDEDAIAAAQSLGGCGVRVGAADTQAHYRLDDVAAVHRWLRHSRDALMRDAA